MGNPSLEREELQDTVDTVAAIATPAGAGGIGIVRVSGQRVPAIIRTLFGEGLTPRLASFKKFRDANAVVIDEGVALYFAAPNSYTGEDVLELHGHGGTVVMDLLLARVLELGARRARPGEFTERAFLNGKIDLAQAEAVADVIGSATAQAARSAMNSLQGSFSKRVRALIAILIDLRVQVEGALDFPEEDLRAADQHSTTAVVSRLLLDLDELRAGARRGVVLREGIKVVLAGRPNVGKSSLFNALARADRVIVSSTPGTTRDVIRQRMALDGLAIQLTDTAGVRESDDAIELEGMRRTKREADGADIVILLREFGSGESASEIDFLAGLGAQIIIVYNKIDLHGQAAQSAEGDRPVIHLSAKTGAGVELLEAALLRCAGIGDEAQNDFTARARHLDALQRARDFLLDARERTAPDASELLAEHLRLAQLCLAEITGDFSADDLLGEIFASFCIGK